jgi:hypothetical protein
MSFDPSSGKKQAQIKLPGNPVFDGMIAADGNLYISIIGGKIVSYRGEE